MNKRHNHFTTTLEGIGTVALVGLGLFTVLNIISAGSNKIHSKHGTDLRNLFRDRKEDPVFVIEQTLLNNEWLDKQQFIDGEVSAKNIIGPLSLRGTYNGKPLENFKSSIAYHQKIQKEFEPKRIAIAKKANAAWDQCLKITDVDAAATKLKELVGSVPLPHQHYPTDLSGILGLDVAVFHEKDVVEIRDYKPPSAPLKIPALTKDQVREIAKTVHDYLAAKKQERLRYKDIVRAYARDDFETDREYELWEAVSGEYWSRHYSADYHAYTWESVEAEINEVHEGAVTALMTYVHRSINQRVTQQ